MKITQRQIKNSVGNSEPDDMLMVLEAFVRDLKKRDNSKTTSTQLQQQLGQAIKDLERTNNIVKRMQEDKQRPMTENLAKNTQLER